MTVVAAVMLPVVLLYQGWSYWVFRARIGTPSEIEIVEGAAGAP